MAPRKKNRRAVSPHPDTRPSKARRLNSCRVQRSYVDAEEASRTLTSKPFHETGLGGLAPETRELIFINLLAIPPPYSGRDFRAEQTSGIGQPPISLATFVDLKKSHLTVLQTCRQVYIEAFPKFYASRAYYLANAQDFATLLKFGTNMQAGPQLFPFNSITTLCLKDLVTNRQKWSRQSIENLLSRSQSFTREGLQAERIDEIDPQLSITNAELEEMRSLRKICLCMRVGQELECLRFLFNVQGLERGMIEFVDNFHWTIRSQSVLSVDWKLQYTPFLTNKFYRMGRNFEQLAREEVMIQRDVLDIDSRPSDLVEGDERWVEVEIGARNYDERMPERLHSPTLAPIQFSADHQDMPVEGSVEVLTDDGSDQSSEIVQGPIDSDDDGTRMDNESDQGSGILQGQLDWENTDVEVEEEAGQMFSYPQPSANVDNGDAQAEYDTNRELESSERLPTEDYVGASTESVPEEESGNLQEPPKIENLSGPTVIEPKQGLVDLATSLDDGDDHLQAQMDRSQNPTIFTEARNQDNMGPLPEERTLATTQLTSDTRCQNYRDSQTQTEPAQFAMYNAEKQAESGNCAKFSQGADKSTAAPPPQKVKLRGQGANLQRKLRNEEMPAQLRKNRPQGPHDSALSQAGKELATKPFPKTKTSPSTRQSSQKASKSSHLNNPKLPSTSNSASEPQPQSRQAPRIKAFLHVCFRVAAIVLALSLFYLVLSAKLEHTLGQLLALFLSILLWFAAA